MKEINLDASTPLVTVVLPVYNGEKYLGQCLNSLMSQTYTNFEINLVDDGSTDNTQKDIDNFSYFRNISCHYIFT